MLKIINISLIVVVIIILNVSLCLSENRDSLDKFVFELCVILEKSDLAGFRKLIKENAQLDGSSIDNAAAEKLFSEFKEMHRAYNYKKIYKNGLKNQRRFIAEGKFYLGGHEFGYLTVELNKQEENWVIANINHCK